MSDDLFVDRLLENQKVLKSLSNEKLIMLALSEILVITSIDKNLSPGDKARCISLSSALSDSAGIKF